MQKTTNKQSSKFISKLLPFEASNLRGYLSADKAYIVESYRYYPIYVYDIKYKTWYENSNGYSPSTKRQINQSRPTANTIKLTNSELKQKITEILGY